MARSCGWRGWCSDSPCGAGGGVSGAADLSGMNSSRTKICSTDKGKTVPTWAMSQSRAGAAKALANTAWLMQMPSSAAAFPWVRVFAPYRIPKMRCGTSSSTQELSRSAILSRFSCFSPLVLRSCPMSATTRAGRAAARYHASLHSSMRAVMNSAVLRMGAPWLAAMPAAAAVQRTLMMITRP